MGVPDQRARVCLRGHAARALLARGGRCSAQDPREPWPPRHGPQPRPRPTRPARAVPDWPSPLQPRRSASHRRPRPAAAAPPRRRPNPLGPPPATSGRPAALKTILFSVAYDQSRPVLLDHKHPGRASVRGGEPPIRPPPGLTFTRAGTRETTFAREPEVRVSAPSQRRPSAVRTPMDFAQAGTGRCRARGRPRRRRR